MYMGGAVAGKVIPKNFGSISHLPGSKMIDIQDKLLGKQETEWMTDRRKNRATDIVIVTEKVDGMNAGVLKKDGLLYPIMRYGYDVRTSNVAWIRGFARFVEDRQERFWNLLNDGERICGEWILKTHTLRYDLKHEPFVAFDIIDSNNNRDPYVKFIYRAKQYDFTTAGLVHIGEAMPSSMAIQLIGEGYHHVVGDRPEGVVYRYESNGRFICCGKFVSHPDLGNEEKFINNIHDPDIINYTSRKMVDKYKKYMNC